MKMVLIIVLLLFFVAFGAVGYYVYSMRQQTAGTLPSFQNPFTQPATSFGATTPSTPVNPFASSTPTPYQNPFSSGNAASQPYQNPFEKLR